MSLEKIEGQEGLFEIYKVKIYCKLIPLECGYIVKDIKNREYKIIEKEIKKRWKKKK